MSTTGTTRVDIPGRSTYECVCGFGIIDDSDDVDGFYDEVYEHERWHELEDERAAADVALPTFNEAVKAEAVRKSEAAMDEMWASRERRPHFAPPPQNDTAGPLRRWSALIGAILGIVVALALVFWGTSAAMASPRTVEVFWSMPDGGTPESVTWPQNHSPGGAVECGVWYQVDTYTKADAKRFTRDGVLTYGEDHGYAISWRFVYGGDCAPEPEPTPTEEPTPDPGPQPENEVEVQFRDAIDCEAGHVVVEEFHRHAGYYLGKDGQWHLGGFGDWFLADTFTRDLNPGELEACTPVSEPEPTPEPTEPPVTEEPTEPEPTTPPVTEPPTDPVDPEPTTPVQPEPTDTPTTVAPSPDAPTQTPVELEPGPTEEPTSPSPREGRTVTPDVPVVDEDAQADELAVTGADGEARLIVAALMLVLAGAAIIAVRRIRGQR